MTTPTPAASAADSALQLETRLAAELRKFTAERDGKPARPAQRPERQTHAIRVTLSVRHRDAGGAPYGNPIRFTHIAKGEVSTLAAEVDARKKARTDGYVVWEVLDITVVEV